MWEQNRGDNAAYLLLNDDCAAMSIAKVTIEDVNFTVKLNFKEIMSQTLICQTSS